MPLARYDRGPSRNWISILRENWVNGFHRISVTCVLWCGDVLVRQVNEGVSACRVAFLVRAFRVPPYEEQGSFKDDGVRLVLASGREVYDYNFVRLVLVSVACRRFNGNFVFDILCGRIFALCSYRAVGDAYRDRIFCVLAVTDQGVCALCGVRGVFVFSVSLAFFGSELRDAFPRSLGNSRSGASVPFAVREGLRVAFVRVESLNRSADHLALIRRFDGFHSVQGVPTRHDHRVFHQVIYFRGDYLVDRPQVADDVEFVRYVEDRLFPIHPGLLGCFKVVAILPSTFGGLELRVI